MALVWLDVPIRLDCIPSTSGRSFPSPSLSSGRGPLEHPGCRRSLVVPPSKGACRKSCKRCATGTRPTEGRWCGRRDDTPQGVTRWDMSTEPRQGVIEQEEGHPPRKSAGAKSESPGGCSTYGPLTARRPDISNLQRHFSSLYPRGWLRMCSAGDRENKLRFRHRLLGRRSSTRSEISPTQRVPTSALRVRAAPVRQWGK
jgi:hypothetical protein